MLVVGLAAGFGGGYVYLQPQIDQLRADLAATEQEKSTAQTQVQQLTTEKEDLTAEKTSLQRTLSSTEASLESALEDLSSKVDELERTLEELQSTEADLDSARNQIRDLNGTVTQVKKIMAKLDYDRLLLIELRKDLPETREATRTYWDNVKSIAVESDPSLGPSVDKVIVLMGNYFDWLDRMPLENATMEEWWAWLIDDWFMSGAADYIDAIDAFANEALLVVINHIGTAVELVS